MKKQFGIAHIGLVLAVIIIAVVGLVGWRVVSDNGQSKNNSNSNNSSVGTTSSDDEPDPNGPPLKLKSIGINLDHYKASTGMAGDLKFTKNKLEFNRLWMDYGFVIPANQTAGGQDKANPQPTFILPAGTKVLALVDGVVVDIPKLYSDDYSVMVAPDKGSQWRYETEHVINPLVKVGDKVKAGQPVAEVSPHNTAPAGYGIVEIGILKGGNPPQHICPFAYLDSSVKDDIVNKMISFYKSWEEYKGDSSLYDENLKTPGCITLDPIEG